MIQWCSKTTCQVMATSSNHLSQCRVAWRGVGVNIFRVSFNPRKLSVLPYGTMIVYTRRIHQISHVQVLEFEKGRLQNLFWKRDGCDRCSNNNTFVCINNQDCAIRTNHCKYRRGPVDCSIAIQLAFSGTDKHLSVFNSWYEVSKLRQYSLFNLYSNLRDSLTSQYNKIF